MGLFSKIKDAKANQGGVYPLPGNYVCEVLSCKIAQTRKGEDFFVTDLKVIHSDVADRKPGCVMSWMAMSSWDGFAGLVKGFIVGVMGCEEGDVDEDMADTVVGDAQPLVHEYVKMQATNVKTKSGGDFTRCVWFPISKEEYAAEYENEEAAA